MELQEVVCRREGSRDGGRGTGGAGSTQRVGPRACIDCLAPHQAPEGFGKKSVGFFLRVFPPEAAPRYNLRCVKLRVLKGLCQDPVSHPSHQRG